jgi:hypothetical protein
VGADASFLTIGSAANRDPGNTPVAEMIQPSRAAQLTAQ